MWKYIFILQSIQCLTVSSTSQICLPTLESSLTRIRALLAYEEDGDDEYLAFIGITRRDKIKLEMQSFRNFKTYGQAESQHPMLAKKFKQMFPTICRWLFTYPNYVNSKGKNTKRLQKDMSQIETMLISKVCFRLKAMGLNPFTLHDAVYLSEAELNTLADGAVDKLFWEIFDTVTPEEVKASLMYTSGGDRSNV